MTIEEQKKAVRAGYDMDIIPSDLATYGAEAKKLLAGAAKPQRAYVPVDLPCGEHGGQQAAQLGQQRLSGAAPSRRSTTASSTRLDFQQEEGFMSSLPLGAEPDRDPAGADHHPAWRSSCRLPPRSCSRTARKPCTAGMNALSNNLIMVDRKLLKNPNGLILGTPGSGKSFCAKREIANVFLVTNDDIIICDPEAEYGAAGGAPARAGRQNLAHLHRLHQPHGFEPELQRTMKTR